MRRSLPRYAHTADGFTLVELLVALAILAITSALAFRGIAAVGEHRNRVESQRLRSVQIEQTFAQLQADIDHLINMSGAGAAASLLAVTQRVDGLILLRKPRVLVDDAAGKAATTEAAIEVIRYQTSSAGLARAVLGRARDPLDLQLRLLGQAGDINVSQENTRNASRASSVTLLPEARSIEVLAWSKPANATNVPGGDWQPLAEFNQLNNSREDKTTTNAPAATATAPAAAASAPASAASAAATSGSSANAATPTSQDTALVPRALKLRVKLDNGVILERIYMAGPNA